MDGDFCPHADPPHHPDFQCLQQYVQLAIREGGGAPVTCPDMACLKTGALLDSEIACFAPVDQVQLYQRLRFERGTVPRSAHGGQRCAQRRIGWLYVSGSPKKAAFRLTKAWCPVVECQAVCRVKPSAEGQPTSVPCPACNNVFCSSCKGPWQDGHTCPERRPLTAPTQEDSTPLSCEADGPIKQCPMCGVYIERNQGCAQMLCKSCKHTFCWYCLQNLD
ncbi:hypothetical protein Z043_110729, partial [Scleropages formosus]